MLAAIALAFSNVSAQTAKWIDNVKLSGYGIAQYQFTNQDKAKSNSFNLRLGRVSLDGRLFNDWAWKVQIQFNGNTSTLGSSPRVVDLFTEWQKYTFFRVKIGQYKNPFTFENPIHPITQGFMGYSQVVSKFAGFADRAGTHSSNGRDIGVQIQGDFLKNSAGKKKKNIIGGVWVMPVKGMRIGWFGWTGSYARKGTWIDATGATQTGVRKLQQRRYAVSAEYIVNDWTFRSEYAHSTGEAFAKSLVNTNDAAAKDCNIGSNGSKAQGVYASVIAPIVKEKLYGKARYDMYQPSKGAEKQRTLYEVGLNYQFNKNVLLSTEYAYVHDRSLAKPNYSLVDVQLSFKF